MKKKLNVLLLISFVLGALYLLYSVYYWGGAGSSGMTAYRAGAAIATYLVMPHLASTAVAVIFNGLGLFMHKPSFALVGAILYAVAMVLFPMYFFFVVAQTVLSFVGFSQLRKAGKEEGEE
ncbi:MULTISPECIES: hypothetical protein [Olsenella]|uniref:hypothetical protein n=1 Tax=Olsenella TaxID=133925 RepID=UPI0007850B2B|nr:MULTISPECIES: hypothetical protein [Olsenella]KXB62012.1 hypothetical protein HMPREF1868_01585 [Olsenella sp. DNF00959]